MKRFGVDNVLAVVAVVLSSAWVIAYAAGWLVGTGWPARLGLLCVGLLLAGGSAAMWLRRTERNCRAIRRHLNSLCRLDSREISDQATLDQLPPLGQNRAGRELAEGVHQAIVRHCRRLEDLEHARSAVAVRCRRTNEQYERMKSILSGLDEPIIAVDGYGELLLANPRAEALFKFDAKSTQTRAIGQLVRCRELIDLLTTTRNSQSDAGRSGEIEIGDSLGESRWFRVTARKLCREGEASGAKSAATGGAVVVLRDIGNQKAMQKRHAEFVSSVSHEMKTPLAGIKAYVELLADGEVEDDAQRQEFLEVIDSQANRLHRLVENLLNLARIEAGVVKVDKRTRPLNEVLEEAVNVVQPAAEAKRITLVKDLSPMYLGVLADRDMLLQTAINLLSNAIKYTPDKGRITLRSRLVDDEVRFEVEDTGVGLNEEDSRRVFEKFYRVKKDKEMAPGTGLGLPLAKHIVEDVHGGCLSVESTLGQGSTFAVTLSRAGEMSTSGV